ncbi:tetratricopeptide repeat protein [Prosthecobacter sp.]|uniref:tetratricopeptide repeat protein n=1 Tax=Prosthecobacter sp. TaxID=1965333 RepID=UPI003784B7D6
MIVQEADLDPKYQNLWKKALISAERKNWEYVIDQVLPIVTANVGFLDGRKLLRSAEGEVAGGGKKFSFGLGSFKPSSKKDPAETIADMEENVFRKDPFNIGANEQLYDIAMKMQFPDLASFALETIKGGHPENTKNMHKLAQHYMAIQQPEKAAATYLGILKVNPRDMEAMKGEKDAAAQSSIKNQGWGSANFKDAMKDSGEAAKLEMLSRQGMTKEQMEQFLAETIEQYNADQGNIVIVKRMSDLYERLGQMETALMFYDYALTLNAGDIALQRKVEILRDKVQDQKIEEYEREIETNPEAPDIDDKRAQLAEIRRQRAAVVISDAKTRVDRNPTDKALRYELGQAYFNAGMYGEALPELQQAKSNPNLRIKAILMLGRCFERKNMNDLAKTSLMEASKELLVMDATKKEVLYELANVLEKMGDKTASLDALKEIYNADYGYKDVARRVESSYT